MTFSLSTLLAITSPTGAVADGSLKWVYPVGGNIYNSPAIGPDGTIYVISYALGASDKNLHAIFPNGITKWSYPLNTAGGSPVINYDGILLCPLWNNNTYLTAINQDGNKKWDVPGTSSPSVGSDGTIYAISYKNGKGGILAINPIDGSDEWFYEIAEIDVNSSPVIGSDGTVYIGANNGKFYALYKDGKTKWIVDICSTYAPVFFGPYALDERKAI